MARYFYRVYTIDEREETLELSEDQAEHLESEMAGHARTIHEYQTASGKIITDLEIIRVTARMKDSRKPCDCAECSGIPF